MEHDSGTRAVSDTRSWLVWDFKVRPLGRWLQLQRAVWRHHRTWSRGPKGFLRIVSPLAEVLPAPINGVPEDVHLRSVLSAWSPVTAVRDQLQARYWGQVVEAALWIRGSGGNNFENVNGLKLARMNSFRVQNPTRPRLWTPQANPRIWWRLNDTVTPATNAVVPPQIQVDFSFFREDAAAYTATDPVPKNHRTPWRLRCWERMPSSSMRFGSSLASSRGSDTRNWSSRWEHPPLPGSVGNEEKNKKFFKEIKWITFSNPTWRRRNAGDEEAKSNFWTVAGEFICRHDVEPRIKLNMPKQELFYWNTCSGGRLARKPTTSRPDDVWPDVWKQMSDEAKMKAKRRSAIEKPKFHNARHLRGMFFIEPNDEEFTLRIKAARRKLEVPMTAAMPCKIPSKSSEETHRDIGKNKTKCVCVVDTDEWTRPRLEGAGYKPHQDHITGKFEFYNAMWSCAQIHSDASSILNSRCKGGSGERNGKNGENPGMATEKLVSGPLA